MQDHQATTGSPVLCRQVHCSNDTIAYTDAGAMIAWPRHLPRDDDLCVAFGTNTKTFGELWAIATNAAGCASRCALDLSAPGCWIHVSEVPFNF